MTADLRSMPLVELFDSLEDVVVWIKDRRGRYRWVNRMFLVNHALESSEPILGKTDYDLSPGFLADQFRLDDEQVLAGRRIVNRIELVGPSPETAAWHVTNKIPFRNGAGKIAGTAGLTRRLNQDAPEIVLISGFGPVLGWMRDHYAKPITNQQLARLAHLSVRAFERKFQASFHLTPQKYLRKLRLGLASRALVFAGQSLVEVALSCGFADQSHFTREFRRHFGRTPKAYRDHYARAVPRTESAVSRQ